MRKMGLVVSYTWERMGRSLGGGNSEKNGFGGFIRVRENKKMGLVASYAWERIRRSLSRGNSEKNGFGGGMKGGVVGTVIDMVDWGGGEHDRPVVNAVWKSMHSLSLMRLGSEREGVRDGSGGVVVPFFFSKTIL